MNAGPLVCWAGPHHPKLHPQDSMYIQKGFSLTWWKEGFKAPQRIKIRQYSDFSRRVEAGVLGKSDGGAVTSDGNRSRNGL